MSNKYLRKQKESDFHYKVRLEKYKLEDKDDIDWAEIKDYLKLDCSFDHLRKTAYGTLEAYNYLTDEKTKNIEDDILLKELENKKEELQKERKKLQLTKIEHNRNQRTESKFELLYENIKDMIPMLEVPEFQYLQNEEENSEYVLQFSDVHYGATFKSENNEYSREISKERFEKLLSKTIDLIHKEKINKLHIVNNSDSLQGLLRISDVKMNDIPIVEATIEFSHMMAAWLNKISEYTEVVYYHISSANHTELRLLNTQAGQMANEDLEKIIVNYICDLLRNNPRVEVPITTDKPYVNFDLCGYDFIALHGHQIKNIQTSLKDLSMLHKKFYSFVMMGHFHNSKEISVGEGMTGNAEILVSPSIVGSCPYADSLLVGGKSMAKLHKFSESNGRECTYNILLN